ncbi:MAG: AAA family ATPase [Acidimicrobiales bacterium]|nr:AAA family ATPase [Acidimicrobiales bacterium]RZV46178.1 MAG: hypothetical protein EX269_08005 [Acidimicrobiales bacterium]
MDATAGPLGSTRLLAVLVADQVDSTAQRHELGDEQADAQWAAIISLLVEAVTEEHGRVIKNTGDGLMAVFGAASSALDAAILMQRKAARSNRLGDSPADIVLRIGVSAGDVTIDVDDCHGIAVVEAARLQSAASPNGVLCTETARTLASSRSMARFGPTTELEAKGFDQPIAVRSLTWARTSGESASLPAGIAAEGRYGFFGRELEVSRARTAWDMATEGTSTAILVGGEPGVGKSRFARECAVRALETGGLVLHGRCGETVSQPFQPFALAFEAFLDHPNTKLEDDLGLFPSRLQRLSPRLRSMLPFLDVEEEDEFDDTQFQLFNAIRSWLTAASARTPIMLVIDDLQWANDATASLLHYLSANLGSAHVCVVATYRTTEESGAVALKEAEEAAHSDHVDNIVLKGLNQDGVSQIADAVDVGPLTQEARDTLARRLYELSGGNPFYAIELLGLAKEFGADALDSRPAGGLEDLVRTRVERLGPIASELLGIAAVSGWRIQLDVLSAASGRNRSELIDALEELETSGLLIEEPNLPVRYRFQHDLVRTSIFDDLSLLRRTENHHQLAHAIEQVHGLDSHEEIDQLAYHYQHSDYPEDAEPSVRCSWLAGREAMRLADFEKAADHFHHVIARMDQAGVDAPVPRSEVLLTTGIAQRKGGIRGARKLLLEAGSLAAETGAVDVLVRAALNNNRGFFSSAGMTDQPRVDLLEQALAAIGPDDSVERAELLANLSVELTFSADQDRRREASDESLTVAERLEDKGALVHVLNRRVSFLWSAAGLDDRRVLCARLTKITDELDVAQWKFGAASNSFQAAMESGDIELADQSIDRMVALTTELGQPAVESYLRMRQSIRRIVAGDLAEGEELAQQCFELSQAAGHPDALTFYFAQLVNLRYHQGRLGELIEILEREVEREADLPSLKSGLALAYAEVGRREEARTLYLSLVDLAHDLPMDLSWLVTLSVATEVGFTINETTGADTLYELLHPYRDQYVDNATNWFGSVTRHLAMLEHLRNNHAAADELFAESVERHTSLPAPALLARSEIDWATSLVRRAEPNREKAERLVASCRPRAEQLGLPTVLSRCDEVAN